MINALLFDLYETLVTERGATPSRASSLGARLGLEDTAFRHAWKLRRPRVIRGELSFAEALHEVAVELSHLPPDAGVVRSICEERRRDKAALFSRFDEEVLDGLRQLRACDVKLAIVSNCFREDVEAWSQCQIAPLFDVSLFSFEVGSAKPERRIYSEALQRLQVDPDHAVFIGDGGDDELAGAQRAGLRAAKACWFRDDQAGQTASIPRLPAWQEVIAMVAAG